MPLDGFSVLNSVLCEEVRQESSGRAIIIGAMANGPSLPEDEDKKIKRLSLYLEVQMPRERVDLYVQLIKGGAEDPVLFADFDTAAMYNNMPEPDDLINNPIAVVVMGRENFNMRGSGEYHLQYATTEGEWKDFRTFYFPPEYIDEE